MNLSITFYDGEDQASGDSFDFNVGGFDELVESGLFSLPICRADDGARSIDLAIFHKRVTGKLESLVTPHPRRRDMLAAVETYRYLTVDN